MLAPLIERLHSPEERDGREDDYISACSERLPHATRTAGRSERHNEESEYLHTHILQLGDSVDNSAH